MRVLMLRFGGLAKAEKLLAGKEYDVPQELAEAMVADGRAILVNVKQAPENAARRTGRPTQPHRAK